MFDGFSGDEDTLTPPQNYLDLQPDYNPDGNDPDYQDIESGEIFNFTDDELKAIHLCIQEVSLPTWVAWPPINLGEVSHGKLKED